MKSIRFSNSFKGITVRDLQDLMEQITNENRFAHKKIYINRHEEFEADYHTMTNIHVNFQVFEEGESGRGTGWLWERRRAKDFCCSNSYFVKIGRTEDANYQPVNELEYQ